MRTENFFSCMIVFFLSLTSMASAQIVTVTGIGISESAAVQNAKRNAVEQVVGTAIRSRAETVDLQLVFDAIDSRTQGYVNSCEVIDKTSDGNLISVTARIDVSAAPDSSLMKDVDVIMSLNDPRIAVVTEHYGDDGGEIFKRYAERCSAAIREKLVRHGFSHVVEKPIGIDYIIIGYLTVGQAKNISIPDFANLHAGTLNTVETGLSKTEAIMDCKIKKVDTDEIIGEFHAVGSSLNSSGNEDIDNKAVSELANSASEQVREIFNRKASNIFSSVKVIVSSDGEKILTLEEFLRQCQGVTGVYVRSFSAGKCIMDVSTDLEPRTLYQMLSTISGDDLVIRMTGFSSTVLELSVY